MEATQAVQRETRGSTLDRPLSSVIAINWETILFTVILLLAFFSRFYILGARTMSHDETSHVYFSWLLEQGRGYKHDPITHGPLQFHLVALSYFIFGDNDFTARIPAALFSIAAVAFVWFFRRYLGRAGTIIGAALMLISPYMLYYGRYVRNEAFVALFGLITLWAMLRYLETGKPFYLFWLVAATALHFTTKETAFIYTAQALIFLAFYLIYRISQQEWPNPGSRNAFLISLIGALLLLGGAVAYGLINRKGAAPSATQTITPAVPGQIPGAASSGGLALIPLILLGVGAIAILAAAFFLIRGYTWQRLRSERSFGMLVVLGTMVLPMLAPFPVKYLGYNPLDYNNSQTMLFTSIFVIGLGVIAFVIGLAWNPRLWLISGAIFYAIFTVFYTTIFTNGAGFVTGLVGSLGYWLEQQGVNRGSQPWYYYGLIQVPMYEYLPALGSILALFYWLRGRKRPAVEPEPVDSESPAILIQEPGDFSDHPETIQPDKNTNETHLAPDRLAIVLLGFWAVTALIAYSVAGEKMPWLTVHITLPMILLAGWALGQLVESIDWDAFRTQRGWLILVLLPVFLTSALATLGILLGPNLPFQGKELSQLQNTSTFITALLTALISGWGLAYLMKKWAPPQISRIVTLAFFVLLGFLTARTAFRASYIDYNYATEYLVYAHMAPGPKEVIQQIEDISRRTTDGLALEVAYDNETSYPFWWYLRNYPNQKYYGDNPTRDLRNAPVILVGDANYDKIGPVVGQAYYEFNYTRIWWPNQDYFGLTWDRILGALTNPEMRQAIFNIWLSKDYTLYGQLTNNSQNITLTGWQPSQHMRMYVRKDIVAELWNYGTTAAPVEADPFEKLKANLTPDHVYGSTGSEPGQFNQPRGIAVAPDDSIYVCDTENSRIEHLDADGNVIKVWGTFADIASGPAPGGTLNKPWGIGVGPDGSVFVADTWNHRIEKFTADGEFVKMWGYFGQAEAPDAFWGPRDVAVDQNGKVYVTDTGNKRVVIFDSDGNYITQFGSAGLAPGQFDEPVGVAVSNEGVVFVADTWNQRIQSFIPASDGSYQPLNSWDVVGWYGQSLDNKPYLAVDSQGNVFATDPESGRVLEYTDQGKPVRYWDDFGSSPDSPGMVGAVAVDHQNGVWVTDVQNGRVLHFTMPAN